MSVRQGADEKPRCLVCGKLVRRRAAGIPGLFCSDACRQKDYRETQKWARSAAEASLAGEPDPPKSWRYETRQTGE